MPRKMHPNSLANLKRGKATQFGANGERTAKEAGKQSGESRREISSFAEAMRAQMNGETREKLASALIVNMPKSPEWYKLGLRMMGELLDGSSGKADGLQSSTGSGTMDGRRY